MSSETKPILAVSCEQMREMDRRAIEEFHIPVETLMENAGRAVAEESIKFLDEMKIEKPWKVIIFCGSGNNAGDGLVTAGILKEKNVGTKIIFLKPAISLKGATLLNFEKIKNAKIPYQELPEMETLKNEIKNSTLLIDALLGTGFKGQVTGLFQKTITMMNASEKLIVAIDLPSGLDADTGQHQGTCVRAHLTVTMGAMKKGFLEKNASECTGKIVVADIGFPKELIEKIEQK